MKLKIDIFELKDLYLIYWSITLTPLNKSIFKRKNIN